MKPGDKDKLNQCLDILHSTDLGLSLVWLYTWSTIKNLMDDDYYECTQTEDQMWNNLCEAVAADQGFTLEYGAEDHYEHVLEWMTNRGYLIDPEEIEED
jgi:hypothetical protein